MRPELRDSWRIKIAHLFGVCPRCLGQKRLRYISVKGPKRSWLQAIGYRLWKRPSTGCFKCKEKGTWESYWITYLRSRPSPLAQTLSEQLFELRERHRKTLYRLAKLQDEYDEHQARQREDQEDI